VALQAEKAEVFACHPGEIVGDLGCAEGPDQ
jgi:hypothetical protein